MGYQKDLKYMQEFVSQDGMEITRRTGRGPGYGPAGWYQVSINGKPVSKEMLLKDLKTWFSGFYVAKTGKPGKF